MPTGSKLPAEKERRESGLGNKDKSVSSQFSDAGSSSRTQDDSSDESSDDSEEDSKEGYESSDSDDRIDSEDNMHTSSDQAHLFNICEGPCTGNSDRISLLLTQTKVLDARKLTDGMRADVFLHVLVRSEAESLEEEPWITSCFSVVPYASLSACMYKEVAQKVAALEEDLNNLLVLLSLRFRNVPDDVTYEMYVALHNHMGSQGGQRLLLLSAERPLQKEEESELLEAFRDAGPKSLGGTFPVNSEEVFLQVLKIQHRFAANAAGVLIRAYVLTRHELGVFLEALKEYFESEEALSEQ